MAMLQSASAIELDGQPSPGLFRCQASSKHRSPFAFVGCIELNASLYALAPQPPRTWVVGEVIWNFFVEADESASVVVLEARHGRRMLRITWSEADQAEAAAHFPPPRAPLSAPLAPSATLPTDLTTRRTAPSAPSTSALSSVRAGGGSASGCGSGALSLMKAGSAVSGRPTREVTFVPAPPAARAATAVGAQEAGGFLANMSLAHVSSGSPSKAGKAGKVKASAQLGVEVHVVVNPLFALTRAMFLQPFEHFVEPYGLLAQPSLEALLAKFANLGLHKTLFLGPEDNVLAKVGEFLTPDKLAAIKKAVVECSKQGLDDLRNDGVDGDGVDVDPIGAADLVPPVFNQDHFKFVAHKENQGRWPDWQTTPPLFLSGSMTVARLPQNCVVAVYLSDAEIKEKAELFREYYSSLCHGAVPRAHKPGCLCLSPLGVQPAESGKAGGAFTDAGKTGEASDDDFEAEDEDGDSDGDKDTHKDKDGDEDEDEDEDEDDEGFNQKKRKGASSSYGLRSQSRRVKPAKSATSRVPAASKSCAVPPSKSREVASRGLATQASAALAESPIEIVSDSSGPPTGVKGLHSIAALLVDKQRKGEGRAEREHATESQGEHSNDDTDVATYVERPSKNPQPAHLRQVFVPKAVMPYFLKLSAHNSRKGTDGIETCAFLCGVEKDGKLVVEALYVPDQFGGPTFTEVTAKGNAGIAAFCEKHGYILLGWIHTHPSQGCFLSSVDQHTHLVLQRAVPEAVAIVVAVRRRRYGAFILSDEASKAASCSTRDGMSALAACHESSAQHHLFHAGAAGVEGSTFIVAEHAAWDGGLALKVAVQGQPEQDVPAPSPSVVAPEQATPMPKTDESAAQLPTPEQNKIKGLAVPALTSAAQVARDAPDAQTTQAVTTEPVHAAPAPEPARKKRRGDAEEELATFQAERDSELEQQQREERQREERQREERRRKSSLTGPPHVEPELRNTAPPTPPASKRSTVNGSVSASVSMASDGRSGRSVSSEVGDQDAAHGFKKGDAVLENTLGDKDKPEGVVTRCHATRGIQVKWTLSGTKYWYAPLGATTRTGRLVRNVSVLRKV